MAEYPEYSAPSGGEGGQLGEHMRHLWEEFVKLPLVAKLAIVAGVAALGLIAYSRWKANAGSSTPLGLYPTDTGGTVGSNAPSPATPTTTTGTPTLPTDTGTGTGSGDTGATGTPTQAPPTATQLVSAGMGNITLPGGTPPSGGVFGWTTPAPETTAAQGGHPNNPTMASQLAHRGRPAPAPRRPPAPPTQWLTDLASIANLERAGNAAGIRYGSAAPVLVQSSGGSHRTAQ